MNPTLGSQKSALLRSNDVNIMFNGWVNVYISQETNAKYKPVCFYLLAH